MTTASATAWLANEIAEASRWFSRSITVENSTLVLKGEKKFDSDVKEENYRRIERTYGTFHRSFTLPNTVDASKVSAEFKNGVLTVKLPFREEAKPRTVNVDVAV